MSRFQYRVYFPFLETRDEYFHHGGGLGRWRIYGIHLPDDVLKKVYYKNATKLLGWISERSPPRLIPTLSSPACRLCRRG